MARYKSYSYEQSMLIPINFNKQIIPGTFEYALNYIVDNELQLNVFESRYKNDETGAPAYDPAILLKIVLYAYSKGIISSRLIERLCRENVICGYKTAFYHHCRLHFVHARANHSPVPGYPALLSGIGFDRQNNVCHRRMQTQLQRVKGMERNTP